MDTLPAHALADAILSKSAWKMWYSGNDRDVRVHAPGTGLSIGHLLVTRLQARCRERGVRLLLVMQGKDHDRGSETLLEHARAEGIETVDLVATYRDELARDPGTERRLFDGHMTPAGNTWVAAHLSRVLGPVPK